MNRTDGKVALISGSARGLGAETARVFTQGGGKVLVADILDDVGKKTVEELKQAGADAAYVHLDVTSESDWENAVKTAVDTFGSLDVLVNNAGIFFTKRTEKMTLADWRLMTSVNLDGVFLGTKAALPALAESAAKAKVGSAIVNLSSVAGLTGARGASAYCMSKGGVRLYTKACALEFAQRRIRVNSVHPGLIDTDMGQLVIDSAARGNRSPDKVKQAMQSSHPIGRLGVPTDIANGVVYLASDDAAFMTGSELVIDGGSTAQ
ncbi:MAG: glucose 1-dehydrogenase [Pseudomonadales bacterium]|nr:glucose 1-dehydrogenase [Pseudomonadales bacterium]